MRIRLRRGPSRFTDASTDRGSLPMALLVSLVGMSLTAALVPVVVSQITSTRAVSGRTQSLDAAQAGIDAALGQLRAATHSGTPMVGELELLPPCTMTGRQEADGLRYRVTIAYYGLPDDAADTTPLLLDCPPLDMPVTATLTATGTGSPNGSLAVGDPDTRTIEATYTFKTNNENITGGAIQLASPTTDPLCMDGGTTPVTMQLCDPGGSSDQRFAYTTDLNIKLVLSATTSVPDGLCLDAPLPHSSGSSVELKPCLGRSARQQWSLDNGSQFRGTPDGVALDNFCINLRNPGLAGSPLEVGGCGGQQNRVVFRPQTGTGAGMASAATGQLVNYKQFSRCLDVTNHQWGWDYMIVWFCKQAPDGNVAWNQKWTLPTVVAPAVKTIPERIRTAGSGNPGACLRTPTSTAGFVTMSLCSLTGALTDDRLKWTVYGNTGTYATSYRIVDTNGNCLTPADLTVPNPEVHGDGTAKLKVAPCDDSELQKWNAPADLNEPLALTNTREK
jgi:hypothetical protein